MNLIDKAKAFAYERHAGQTRKGGNKPFTNHLDRVAETVSKMTDDQDLIITAWLHDVVEDTDTTLQEVIDLFGERVGKFVSLESEDKRPHLDEKDSWQARKEEQINELNNTPEEYSDVFMVALADKLANTTEMLEAIQLKGPSFWNEFNNSDPVAQEWYYRSFADIIHKKTNLGTTDTYKSYVSVLDSLFTN